MKMSTTWFRGDVEKHFLGHRKLQRDHRSAVMLPWLRREYVLTHEEGLLLSDDAVLALVRICLTPRSRRGKPRARDKDNVEARRRVATLSEEANFGEKGSWKSCHIGRRSQFWREGRWQLGWQRGAVHRFQR